MAYECSDMCGGPLGEASFRFIGDFVSTSLTQFEQSLVDEYCENEWCAPISWW